MEAHYAYVGISLGCLCPLQMNRRTVIVGWTAGLVEEWKESWH